MTVNPEILLKAIGQRANCTSCNAPIYWLMMHQDKITEGKSRFHPANPDGTSHFSTCPQAAEHRKEAPKAEAKRQKEIFSGTKPCRQCGRGIDWTKTDAGKWRAVNKETGTLHFCKAPPAAINQETGRVVGDELPF